MHNPWKTIEPVDEVIDRRAWVTGFVGPRTLDARGYNNGYSGAIHHPVRRSMLPINFVWFLWAWGACIVVGGFLPGYLGPHPAVRFAGMLCYFAVIIFIAVCEAFRVVIVPFFFTQDDYGPPRDP